MQELVRAEILSSSPPIQGGARFSSHTSHNKYDHVKIKSWLFMRFASPPLLGGGLLFSSSHIPWQKKANAWKRKFWRSVCAPPSWDQAISKYSGIDNKHIYEWLSWLRTTIFPPKACRKQFYEKLKDMTDTAHEVKNLEINQSEWR